MALLRQHGVQFETRPCDGSPANSATFTIDPVTKHSTQWHTECWGLQDPRLSFLVVEAASIPSDAVAGAIHDYRHASVPGRKSNEAICCSAYDEVIGAVGWTHDTTMYADARSTPVFQANRKFPRQTAIHESINVPGMYFAGSLAHARDWKKGAGGFVHGFRYTAKFLARVLAAQAMWNAAHLDSETPHTPNLTSQVRTLHTLFPSRQWDPSSWPLQGTADNIHSVVSSMTKLFLSRINEASAPYQMTCNFGDGFVVDQQRAAGSLDIHFVEDVPLAFFLSHFCASRHCFFWSFCFGSRAQYQSLHSSLSQGTGFGPVILYYDPADGAPSATPTQSRASEKASSRPFFESANRSTASRPRDAVDLGESITTTWEGAGFTRTLDTFFSRHLQSQLAARSAAPPGAINRRGSGPSRPQRNTQPLLHTPSTFRNLTVLTWVVNDLPHSVGSASVVGPGPHDKGNAGEVSVAGVAHLLRSAIDPLVPKFASHDSTVVAGLPDFSPALLFHSSLPRGKHTRFVETYDGAVWRSTSTELVEVVANNDSSTTSTARYRRQRVSREWTIHFANGPFQEVYLSEVPAIVQSSVLSSNSCREAAACKLYGHSPQQSVSPVDSSDSDGNSGHILDCEVLQADVDALSKLVRNGHYSTLIHLDGHTQRTVSDLCPCSCPAPTASTVLPDAALEELEGMINNLTVALETVDDTASLERQLLQLRALRRKRALFDELQSASLRGDSREHLHLLRAEFLAVSQEAREVSQKTTVTELRDALFSGVIPHTEALTKKQQLVTLMKAMRRAHVLSSEHSAAPFNVFAANLSSVTVSTALLDDGKVEMLAHVLIEATNH
eukprot:INCI15833.1.p1 GENE.INCI15833.1~~INCI15833.1.p1  ORF type:complete len:840 (-),score=112.43 INCI15833.1:106-2625(-)